MPLPLFVYGTLKRAARGTPHELLEGARFLTDASMSGLLYDLGDYPGVYRNGGSDSRVSGELFGLSGDPDQTLRALDRYEGSEFVRKRVFVTLSDGERRMAWAHVLRKRPGKVAEVVRTGRYSPQ